MKEIIKDNKFFFTNLFLLLLFIPVVSVIAANYKSFLVEKVLGYDKLLITDNSSQYIIEYSYECYESDFYEGQRIYIDTYFSPSFWDTILVKGFFDVKTCKVNDLKKVNLKPFFVVSVIDNQNKIIVKDEYGKKYLIEYGIGCGLSMWRYEGKYIDIDIGGSFLDGISDRIYLFDSNKDCKIWDVEELSWNEDKYGSQLGYHDFDDLINEPNNLLICPPNSTYSNGKCVCNKGFVAHNGLCIGFDEYCKKNYGSNAQASGSFCVCKEGYIMRNNKCITYTEYCVQHFGQNVYGVKGDDGDIWCLCKEGYEWNSSRTACVKKVLCPPNARKVAGTCVCNDGYKWDSLKRVCIKKKEYTNSFSATHQLSQREKLSDAPQKEKFEKEEPSEMLKEVVEKEEQLQPQQTQEKKLEFAKQKAEQEQRKSFLTSFSLFLASIFNFIKKIFANLIKP